MIRRQHFLALLLLAEEVPPELVGEACPLAMLPLPQAQPEGAAEGAACVAGAGRDGFCEAPSLFGDHLFLQALVPLRCSVLGGWRSTHKTSSQINNKHQ